MNDMSDFLSEEDLYRLVEDTGLTAAEVRKEYAKAITKAKTEDSKVKGIANRMQRRRQAQQLKRMLKRAKNMDFNRSVSERFQELPEEKQKEVYLNILAKVREKNLYFEKLTEEMHEGTSEGSPNLSSEH